MSCDCEHLIKLCIQHFSFNCKQIDKCLDRSSMLWHSGTSGWGHKALPDSGDKLQCRGLKLLRPQQVPLLLQNHRREYAVQVSITVFLFKWWCSSLSNILYWCCCLPHNRQFRVHLCIKLKLGLQNSTDRIGDHDIWYWCFIIRIRPKIILYSSEQVFRIASYPFPLLF